MGVAVTTKQQRLSEALANGMAIDELALFVAPELLGRGALAWSDAVGARALERAVTGRVLELRPVGRDVLLRVAVKR